MRRVLVVRMDHLRDCQGVWQSQIVVPKPLQPIIGKANLIRTTGIRNTGEASRKAAAQTPSHIAFVAEAQLRIKAARGQVEQHVIEESLGRFVEISQTSYTLLQPGLPVAVNGQGRIVTRPDGQQYLIESLPVEAAGESTSGAVLWEDMLEPWIKRRRTEGKATPTKTLGAMTGKMRRLFGFLGHSDMARVSQPDITRYVEDELMAKQPKFGKRVEAGGYRDHVIYIQALFGLAHRTERIPTDPTTHLMYEKRTGSRGRFTDAERFAIYEAALRSENPLCKWLNLWGIFHGLRPAEIVEADTRDLVFENGIPVFYVQTDYREGDEKTVKTEASKRGLPIHPAFRDGFVAHVQSLPPGPLFSGLKPYHGRRADDASNKLNKWLHKEAGIPKGKTFYWHRHSVKSILEAKHVPDRLNDYLLGHAGPQQVAKVYLHREFPEVVAAIEKVPIPVEPEERHQVTPHGLAQNGTVLFGGHSPQQG